MSRTRKGCFPEYTGSRRYRVDHPRLGTAYVKAPDPDAAIVAAALLWRVNWAKLEVYDNCTVTID